MPDATPFDTLDAAAYQRALAVLLDVGTSIAKELKTPSPDISVIARARAFDVVALAVRRTVILSSHITEIAAGSDRAAAAWIDQRKQVIRAVEETIETKAKPDDAGALRLELLERVDSLDFDADLAHRSPRELIGELCRDLGLANVPGLFKYKRRTPDDIALLCAQAAAPAGSGLARWSALATPQADENDRAAAAAAREIRLKPGGPIAPPIRGAPPRQR